MSTLRVNNIKGRTNTVVTIPEENTLAVTGIVSVTSTGSLTVGGGATITGAVTVEGELRANTLTPRTGTVVSIPSGRNLTIGGGVTVTSGGISVTGGGVTISAGGLNVTGGNFNVSGSSQFYTTTGIITASQLNVTDVFTASGGISIGSTVQPVGIAVSVLGGEKNKYTENGISYESRTFFSDGAFVVNTPIISDFIIIGGGGGGGQHNSTNANGGGGAGGVVVGRGVTLTAGNYYVRVGQGGVGGSGFKSGGAAGEDSFVVCNDVGFAYTGRGGGGGAAYPSSNSYAHIITEGGSGGGTAYGGNGGPNAANQYGYSPLTMPVTTYNSPTYASTGIIKGYGNPGSTGAQTWTGAGGGGAGGAGVGGGPGNSPHPAAGGIGITCTFRYGTIEYLAGGGGGGGNSTEPAGNGAYGGGRGQGATPTSPGYSFNRFTQFGDPGNYGMDDSDALPGTGSGGGAGSYWHIDNAGGPGRGGLGAPGRVTLRWRST